MSLNRELWGEPPTPEKIEANTRINDEGLKDMVKKALDLSDGTQLFAHKLGLSFGELEALKQEKRVASFSAGEISFYPRWQIKNGTLIEGVEKIVEVAEDIDDITGWFERPNVEFDGLAPYEQVRLPGGVEKVARELEILNNMPLG